MGGEDVSVAGAKAGARLAKSREMAKGRDRKPADPTWVSPALDAGGSGFLVTVDDEHLKRERAKARELRASRGGNAAAPTASATTAGGGSAPRC